LTADDRHARAQGDSSLQSKRCNGDNAPRHPTHALQNDRLSRSGRIKSITACFFARFCLERSYFGAQRRCLLFNRFRCRWRIRRSHAACSRPICLAFASGILFQGIISADADSPE
jgi:hypothetical protein